MNQQRLSRIKLIGIFFAFAGPLLIATALYFGKEQFEFGSTARGHLVAAGQTIDPDDFRLIKTEHETDSSALPLLDGRWLLLFNGSAVCDLYCQASLFKMRQARLVLGRDFKRVRTVYLLPENAPSTELSRLLQDYPRFSLYQKRSASALAHGQVYIVDPLGNLVLRYLPNAYSRDIINDLKRLLKASKIG